MGVSKDEERLLALWRKIELWIGLNPGKFVGCNIAGGCKHFRPWHRWPRSTMCFYAKTRSKKKPFGITLFFHANKENTMYSYIATHAPSDGREYICRYICEKFFQPQKKKNK
jgi:hypothetical protein